MGRFFIFLSLIISCLPQKPFQRKAHKAEKLFRIKNTLINKRGHIRAKFRLNYLATGKNIEESARNFLRKKYKTPFPSKQSSSHFNKLHLIKIQKGLNSTHIRFNQSYKNLDVYQADIVISFDKNNYIQMLMTNEKNEIFVTDISPRLTRKDALDRVYNYLKTHEGTIGTPLSKLMVYENGSHDRLIYKINIALSNRIISGDFEILVNAKTGEIISAKNLLKHYKARLKKSGKEKANGTGYVFEPDPLSKAKKKYGDLGFLDAKDSDKNGADSLNYYRTLVTLNDLTLKDGIYHLKNHYVELYDFEGPDDIFPTSSNPNAFRFTRSQQEFEAVNVFYHIDKMRRYIESLGFNGINPQAYKGAIKCDPHGRYGADDSGFYSSIDYLTFGEGGVDDAEDSEVIWHEFGHAIQDFIIDGFIGMEGVDEGFADYWAESYSRSLRTWSKTDEEYYWVFNWDAHNTFSSGRITNLSASYPKDLNSDRYHNCQLWTAPLFQIWEKVGRKVMDKLLIQSQYYLTKNPNQIASAEAILQASNDLYNGLYNPIIIKTFVSYGQLASYDIIQPPNNLTASSYLNKQTMLNWNKPFTSSDSYSFTIERSSDSKKYTIIARDIRELSYHDLTVENYKKYWYRVKAIYNQAQSSYSNIAIAFPSQKEKPLSYAVISLGKNNTSNDSIVLALQKNNRFVTQYKFIPRYLDIQNYDGLFLILAKKQLSEYSFVTIFKPYLDSGGRLYIEGSEVWKSHPEQKISSTLSNYFNITSKNSGTKSPLSLMGVASSLTNKMAFSYSGKENNISQLVAIHTGKTIFTGDTIRFAILNKNSIYKTLGMSIEFGRLVAGRNLISRQDSLMSRILNYFENKDGVPAKISVIHPNFNFLLDHESNATASFRIGNFGGAILHYTITHSIRSNIGSTKETILFSKEKGTLSSNKNELLSLKFNSNIIGNYIGNIFIKSDAANRPTYTIPFSYSKISISELPKYFRKEDGHSLNLNLDSIYVERSGFASQLVKYRIGFITNPSLFTANIANKRLQINLNKDQSGTGELYLEIGHSGSNKIYTDTVQLSVSPVDDAPKFIKLIKNIIQNEKTLSQVSINLNQYFIDPDSELKYTFSQTNAELLRLSLLKATLIISFRDPIIGTTRVTVRATGNGKFVETSFLVSIIDTSVPDINYIIHYPQKEVRANILKISFQFSEKLRKLPLFRANNLDLIVSASDDSKESYSSIYQAKQSEKVTFVLSATDLSENKRDTSFTINVAQINSSKSHFAVEANISYSYKGLIQENHWVYINKIKFNEPFESDFFPLTEQYEIHSTKKLSLDNFLLFEFTYDTKLEKQYKIGVYLLDDKKWIHSNGEGKNNKLTANITKSATYSLFYKKDYEPLPSKFLLKQNFPNPFKSVTTIRFELEKRSHVKLAIFNVLGQHVITLIDAIWDQKKYTKKWHSQDSFGKQVSSGIYFYQIITNEHSFSKKMLLLK